MKPIPNNFRKNGYDYTLLERQGMIAVYEQHRDERTFAYEVVKIRLRPAREIGGKTLEASERLPSDEDWGTLGKTYTLSQTTPIDARNAAKAQMRVWVAEEDHNAQIKARRTQP